jgi:hypothetical protein
MRTKTMDIAAWLGTHLYSVALVLLIALPALVHVGGSDHRSTAVLPPLATTSATLDTAAADAVAEGEDVLMVDWAASPYDLWNALVPHTEWYDDAGTGGSGTFYVPAGSEVLGTTGAYVATLDGWLHYPLDVAAGGRSVPVALHVPAFPADHGDQCAVAAGLLLDAARSWTTRIEEDLSYAGMSPVEAQCNDALATEYWAQDSATMPKVGPWANAALIEYLERRMVPVATDGPIV